MRNLLYILGHLLDTDLQWMLEAGITRRVPGRTVVVSSERPLADVLIVVDGKLGVRNTAGEVGRFGTGRVLGERAALGVRSALLAVATLRESRLFAIPHDVLRVRLRRDGAFATRFECAVRVAASPLVGRPIESASGELLEGARVTGGELSPATLEGVALAGARLDWFLSRARTIDAAGCPAEEAAP